MTTYTSIANNEIDADSPATDTLFTRLRDNPIAIAQGASGAPKIATQSAVSDFDITPADFNSLGAFGGAWFTINGSYDGAGGGPFALTITVTDDGGSTYKTPQTLFTTIASSPTDVLITGFVDFATGEVRAIAKNVSVELTIAGSSSAVDGIRFSSGYAGFECAVIINANGGEQT